MSSIFYVYQYINTAGEIYYIGKGSKTRYREKHLYVDVPDIENIHFVQTGMSEDDAYDLEEMLTNIYGLKVDGTGILENLVHGGKSTHIPSFTGRKHSEAAKRRISQNNTGKVRTAEHKQNYSKPKTTDHAEKIRQANLGRKDSIERCNINRDTQSRPDVAKRKSDAMKAIWQKRKQQGLGTHGKLENKI